MADYQCAPLNGDTHVNSQILSHAYFSLVQQIGALAAGHLLHMVPWVTGPDAGYTAVANAFVVLARLDYRDDPRVATATTQAFLIDAGLTKGPPACIPAAPPPPPPPPPPPVPTPVPTPAPPTQVAVPNVRGDLPGAASSALAAVGLRLGSLTDVTDNTCSHIGTVVSQVPGAGTLVAPGTAVNVTIGQLPPNPCP